MLFMSLKCELDNLLVKLLDNQILELAVCEGSVKAVQVNCNHIFKMIPNFSFSQNLVDRGAPGLCTRSASIFTPEV